MEVYVSTHLRRQPAVLTSARHPSQRYRLPHMGPAEDVGGGTACRKQLEFRGPDALPSTYGGNQGFHHHVSLPDDGPTKENSLLATCRLSVPRITPHRKLSNANQSGSMLLTRSARFSSTYFNATQSATSGRNPPWTPLMHKAIWSREVHALTRAPSS